MEYRKGGLEGAERGAIFGGPPESNGRRFPYMDLGPMIAWNSGVPVPCTGGNWETVCGDGLVPSWQWLLPRVLERATRCSSAGASGPGLVFVGTVVLSQQVAAWLQGQLLALGACGGWEEARGRVVAVNSQEVSASRRREIAADLGSGQTWVAVATRCWSTGVDIPALRWVSLDPGVGAPQSVIQSAGRGARVAGGPSFEILMAPGPHQKRQKDALAEAGYRLHRGSSGIYRQGGSAQSDTPKIPKRSKPIQLQPTSNNQRKPEPAPNVMQERGVQYARGPSIAQIRSAYEKKEPKTAEIKIPSNIRLRWMSGFVAGVISVVCLLIVLLFSGIVKCA